MTKISGGVSSRNPFGPQWATSTKKSETVEQEVQSQLFGKKKPPVVSSEDAEIAAQMARLHAYRKKLARLAGDHEDDYDLVLADGTIAMIDQNGLIYIGLQFLKNHADQVDILVGVLAHEIGHRPKRWAEYHQQRPNTKEEADKLCRLEETRADYFAGRALAELNLQCAPLIGFLEAITEKPHPEYFSPKLRGEVIQEGFQDASRRRQSRKALFPELHRMTSLSGDLGTSE